MIDVKNVNIQKLTLVDLVNDAVDRKDKAALEFLQAESKKKVERKRKDGSTVIVMQPVNQYRVAYLTKFCGYVKKSSVKLNAEQKREKKLNDMFSSAFAALENGG